MLFARKLEFYHTFLLALLKKLESESKSWSNSNLELVRTLYGGIRTTLDSNDRAVRSTITAYQCGTCTTLESIQLV